MIKEKMNIHTLIKESTTEQLLTPIVLLLYYIYIMVFIICGTVAIGLPLIYFTLVMR